MHLVPAGKIRVMLGYPLITQHHPNILQDRLVLVRADGRMQPNTDQQHEGI